MRTCREPLGLGGVLNCFMEDKIIVTLITSATVTVVIVIEGIDDL